MTDKQKSEITGLPRDTVRSFCRRNGQPFTAYGNSKRKYCSHECYIKKRFKGGDASE